MRSDKMTYCPYCGTETSPDDKECPNCHKYIEVDRSNMMYCRYCGKEILKKSDFCPYCGEKVDMVRSKEYPRNSEDREIREEKNVAVAIIMSVIITGLGSLYAGFMKDGLILLILQIVVSVLGFMFFFPWILSVVIWIYGIYDAYKKCDDSNRIWREYSDSL